MIHNYKITYKWVAPIVLLSLFLQSCGNSGNLFIPQEAVQTSRTLKLSETFLINAGKEIVISGGYLASFYEEEGVLKADLKADEIQPDANYKNLPVVVEEGMELVSLTNLDLTTQKNRIELNGFSGGQLKHVTIRKGGVVGGMMEGEQKEVKSSEKEKNTKEIKNDNLQEESLAAAKANFLAHMSHEFRTPLTGILGMLDLINKDCLPEEEKSYLENAKASGLGLLSLLNNILDISKIEAGILNLETTKFKPWVIAQEIVEIFKIDASKKNLDFNLSISSQVPQHLLGDPIRFRQILFNLVSNAIKFTEKGNVSLSIGGVPSADGTRFNLIGQVNDTGIGISPSLQKRLFIRAFCQGDESLHRQFGGSGLGLFITKQLCEIMGGNVKVASEVGKGTAFEFTLNMASYALSNDLSPRIPDTLPPMQILVVEDNPINQKLLILILKKAGCCVTAVWNGQEALEAVHKEHYDIVLMDGEMPVMDGLTATRKIRKTFDAKSLPIIAVTAHAMLHDHERFLNAGMNPYLTKPIQKQILFSEILRLYLEKTQNK